MSEAQCTAKQPSRIQCDKETGLSRSRPSRQAHASSLTRALARSTPGELSDSRPNGRSVRSDKKRWSPPEGLMPEQIRLVIAAANCERDRLLLRVLWATGARVSEALALRGMDVRRDHLVLPNLKNPGQRVKQVYLPTDHLDLPGALLLWQRDNHLSATTPLFVSRKRAEDGAVRAISRQQAWVIVKDASRRADIQVLAMRTSKDGQAGEPAAIHPHLFRHSRVRANLRATKSLPVVQKLAGWTTLQQAYLRPDNEEVRRAMLEVAE